MFERFTDRARRVVSLAQDESTSLGHGYIGTEHLLLGLMREGEGVAAVVLGELGFTLDGLREAVMARLAPAPMGTAAALATLGIDLESVRQKVEETFGEGALVLPDPPPPPFTPRAKRALELSQDAALDLLHNFIGTEHMLLGLLAEGEGMAAMVVADRVALDVVADRVVEVCDAHSPVDPRPELDIGMLEVRTVVPGLARGFAMVRDDYLTGSPVVLDLRDTDELRSQATDQAVGFAHGLGAELVKLDAGVWLLKSPAVRLTRETRRTILARVQHPGGPVS